MSSCRMCIDTFYKYFLYCFFSLVSRRSRPGPIASHAPPSPQNDTTEEHVATAPDSNYVGARVIHFTVDRLSSTLVQRAHTYTRRVPARHRSSSRFVVDGPRPQYSRRTKTAPEKRACDPSRGFVDRRLRARRRTRTRLALWGRCGSNTPDRVPYRLENSVLIRLYSSIYTHGDTC